MSNVDNTAEPTVNEVQDTTLNTETTETPETTVETTEKPLGEILQDEPAETSEKKPNVDFKELFKNERKEKRRTLAEKKVIEERLAELEELIKDGGDKDEIQDEMDELSDEFGVDKDFLKKNKLAIEKGIDKKIKQTIDSRLKPLEEKEQQQNFVNKVTTYFNNALERMPEFKGIANLGTILQLASIPSNKDKTVTQLIEDTYSSAITGKKTIESSSTRGTTEPTEVDFDKAKTDSEYFKQVMANPELKKKYNDGLTQRVLR